MDRNAENRCREFNRQEEDLKVKLEVAKRNLQRQNRIIEETKQEISRLNTELFEGAQPSIQSIPSSIWGIALDVIGGLEQSRKVNQINRDLNDQRYRLGSAEQQRDELERNIEQYEHELRMIARSRELGFC